MQKQVVSICTSVCSLDDLLNLIAASEMSESVSVGLSYRHVEFHFTAQMQLQQAAAVA